MRFIEFTSVTGNKVLVNVNNITFIKHEKHEECESDVIKFVDGSTLTITDHYDTLVTKVNKEG